MAAPDLEDSAWRFAIAVYDKPDVAPACLRLQDEAGVDVVFLLAVGYAARLGLHLDHADLDRLDRQVAAWRQQIVRPLREVRRALKGAGPAGSAERAALRRAIQAAELDAERLQLSALISALPAVAPGATAISALPSLCAMLGRSQATEATLSPLLAMIAAAIDQIKV